jgi:hypothetical protein
VSVCVSVCVCVCVCVGGGSLTFPVPNPDYRATNLFQTFLSSMEFLFVCLFFGTRFKLRAYT